MMEQTEAKKCGMPLKKIGNVFAGAVLAAGLMLGAPKLVQAEPARAKIFASLYDQAKTPSAGVGLGKGFALPAGFSADASIALSSGGAAVNLEAAELDLNAPAMGPLSGTLYIYKDRFYYTERGYGAMLNAAGFHIAGEYVGDNWGVVFAKYVLKLAEAKVRLVPKAVVLLSNKKVEGIGAELLGEADAGGVTLFAKITHTRIPQTGQWMNGNMQVGMIWSF